MDFMQLQLSRLQKPNRLSTTEAGKGAQYHSEYARWVLGDGMSTLHREHIARYNINLNFYKSNQWMFDEDSTAFFKDDENMDNHRLKVVRNYIQPMVEQYKGNAMRMSFDIKATAISPMAKSRRDDLLSRLLGYHQVTQVIPQFKDYIEKQGFPMGKDESETIDKFENVYVDGFVTALNRLLRYNKATNKLDDYKGPLAFDVAVAGIGVMKPYPYNGEWRFKRIEPDKFGWDRAAVEYDLSDSDYFYEWEEAIATSVFERYPNMPYQDKSNLERLLSQGYWSTSINGSRNFLGNRLPVYHSVWRDCVSQTYGYVLDEFNQVVLERINYIADNEENPKYTFKDVLPVSKLTPYQKRVVKGNPTCDIMVDNWRYCSFIPREIIAGVVSDKSLLADVVLEYGILPYQEQNMHQATNMLPPYKVGMWSYVKGEVLSPVDVVINPQRMINRFLSVMEQQINSAGGSGPVYDKDMLEPGTEPEVKIKMKRGEPVGVRAKGRGVSNVVGRYDSGIKESTLVFSNLIENFRNGIEQITGVNDALKGAQQNPDQLVGVMQLTIQRGSIIQEPFYNAISMVFKGCYQSIATSGKRYYIDNESELSDAVGDESLEILKLSKDMKYENFRVELRPNISPESERLYVDGQIAQWIQLGLIDPPTASKLVGRATMDEATAEMRSFNRLLAERRRKAEAAAAEAAQAQQELQNASADAQYAEGRRQESVDTQHKNADRQAKLAQASIQSGKVAAPQSQGT
jgi:hypothetical protein